MESDISNFFDSSAFINLIGSSSSVNIVPAKMISSRRCRTMKSTHTQGKSHGGISTFNEKMAGMAPYILPSLKGKLFFYCAVCDTNFSLGKMGPAAVKRHMECSRHRALLVNYEQVVKPACFTRKDTPTSFHSCAATNLTNQDNEISITSRKLMDWITDSENVMEASTSFSGTVKNNLDHANVLSYNELLNSHAPVSVTSCVSSETIEVPMGSAKTNEFKYSTENCFLDGRDLSGSSSSSSRTQTHSPPDDSELRSLKKTALELKCEYFRKRIAYIDYLMNK